MKAQTYNTNALGTVVNPSSATGFRLEDDHGNWIEAKVVEGKLLVDLGRPLSRQQDFMEPLPLEYPEPIRSIVELVKANEDKLITQPPHQNGGGS